MVQGSGLRAQGLGLRASTRFVPLSIRANRIFTLLVWEGTTTVIYTVVWRNSVGLMRRGRYGAVIGRKTYIFVCAQCEFPGYGFFSANHGAVWYFPLLVKPRNFAKRPCKLQWLTPHTGSTEMEAVYHPSRPTEMFRSRPDTLGFRVKGSGFRI
jgi:hypothetical protein